MKWKDIKKLPYMEGAYKAENGDTYLVGARAKIGERAEIKKGLITIHGSTHTVSLFNPGKKELKIGYECHNYKKWMGKYREIGAANNYSKDQFDEYLLYIKLFGAIHGWD